MSHQKRKGGWAGESIAQESEREDECLVPVEPPGGLVVFSEDRRLSAGTWATAREVMVSLPLAWTWKSGGVFTGLSASPSSPLA